MSLRFLQKGNGLQALLYRIPIFFAVFGLVFAAFTLGNPARAASAATDKGNILLLTVHENNKDGKVFIKLRPDLAPKHIAQIKKLVLEGDYNNVVFHRVIEGFMAQTGDVQYGNRSRYNAESVGMGGSKYPNIPAEFSSEPFKRGTVGMARAQDLNSANSQFFICYADSAFLNNQYTVVGNVIKGMDIIDRLKKGSQAENGKVEGNPDYIVKAELRNSAS